MIDILSKDNLKIKHLRKLHSKKYRDEYSEFLIENFTTIKDAFKSGFRPQQIFITSEFLDKHELEIQKMMVEEIYLINHQVNNSFSNLKTPSGIGAVYSKIKSKIDFEKHIIYLNAINDPGNLGTILRSALAFNLKNIILDEYCVDLYNYKTISASKDSIFKLNIEFDNNLEILKEVKEKMPVFSTSLEKSNHLEILRKENIFCLVLGNESHGVNKQIQNLSDNFIKIEINSEIESLNVASSASIIFYYISNILGINNR